MFKIENFCEEHNEEFKRYYNFLNNPVNSYITFYFISELRTEKIRKIIFEKIKNNKKYVQDKINKIDIIVKYYQENNLINKTEIGKFFTFYEKHIKTTNKNNVNSLYKLFYKLIEYDNVINILKECFYIFSNYRACIYYMTPSINFYDTKKTKKDIVNKTIKAFKDNQNTLIQVISKIYIGEENPWGSIYYTTAYGMLETLMILDKYYKNPLKELDIEWKIIKETPKKDIIKSICDNYHKKKMKKIENDEKMNEKNIHSVSHFIYILKRLGYDLWFTINVIFDGIYKKYILKGIDESLTINNHYIYLQKTNYELGTKIYILNKGNYISNMNIFQKFND